VSTLAHFIRRNSESQHTGLLFEQESFTHAQIVAQACQRAAFILEQRSTGPFHVGVLLDNVPEAIFWLEATGLAGAATVGINSTRRGAELARDINHTDCLFVVTDPVGARLLQEAGIDRPVWVTGSADYETALATHQGAGLPDTDVSESDPFVLIFTSGTTSAPKAAICTHGRIVRVASSSIERLGIRETDVAYNAMPWYHSNALYVSIATSIVAGGTLAMRRRFSASGWLPDVKQHGATFFNYVGKPLEYILATPESPGDAENQLRFGIGNEANEGDIAEFKRRFGVEIIDGFGSTEMGVVISRTPDMPPGALGRARDENTVVMDPSTEQECPRAQFDANGRLTNPDEAIGEFVNKVGLSSFEGYYNNDEANAERSRHGWFWSGDLGYRDEQGFFYFAGRNYDWLRVDGENFAAAPIERILLRFPDMLLVAVYAIPDPHVGDQVMAAIHLGDNDSFDPVAFDEFLGSQADLGTKWAPRFVRLTSEFPLTQTNKIQKRQLRSELWITSDRIWWKPDKAAPYRLFTSEDADRLSDEFERNGRGPVLSTFSGVPSRRPATTDSGEVTSN
jgi:fatty-acyl-CoA synthase